MRRVSLLVALVFVFGSLRAGRAQEDTPESPRLAALAGQLKAGNRAALDAFWTEIKDKAPLIEPIPDDARSYRVSFIWHGDADTRAVTMMGGMPTHDAPLKKPLRRLLDTDLWYRTERLPADSRFTYVFAVNPVDVSPADKEYIAKLTRQLRRDALNPRPFVTPPNASIAELPDAPKQPWLKRLPDVPAGEFKREKFQSAILGEERTIGIYAPPGYDPAGKPLGLVVLFDGEVIPLILRADEVFDNLIAAKKIPPVIAVTVTSGKTRARDLGCSEKFADFLANELVPALRGRYRITADPGQTLITGVSLGGLNAVYCGMRHPEVFGNVLSQSGSFWYFDGWTETTPEDPLGKSGWLAEQFAAKPKLSLRFYLEVGRFEQSVPINMVLENRRMRDVLLARGYPVTYSEYNGGHDYICWRGSLADGLIALLGKKQ